MTTQETRKLKEYKEISIVPLIALVRESDKEKILTVGCSRYSGKHFTVKQLLELVEEISV